MADCFVVRHKNKKINPKNLILYDYGTENTELMGGFYFKGNYLSSAITEKRNDCIYMKSSKDGSFNFLILETSLPIDLTKYSVLCAEITSPTSNPSDYSRFGIGKEPITNNYDGVALVSDPIGKIGEKITVELDISGLSGTYYINLMADVGNEIFVYKVWLR